MKYILHVHVHVALIELGSWLTGNGFRNIL